MPISTHDIANAADALYKAEKDRRQIAPLTLTHPDMDMDEAYAIQRTWVDRKIAKGREITGYKIGLTSRAMQLSMKIDTPDFGILLDDMYFSNGSTIPAANFVPRPWASMAQMT